MKDDLAKEAGSMSPGPSQGRKRKLSSPQALGGAKRNRSSKPRRPADEENNDPVRGLAEELVSLGYRRDLKITVSVHFFISLQNS